METRAFPSRLPFPDKGSDGFTFIPAGASDSWQIKKKKVMFLAPYYGAKLVLIFCWQESWPQEIAQLAVCELNAE